jgi:hypothetical protein
MFENEISPLEEYLPTYYPPGFVQGDRSLWYNRTDIGLQLLLHDSSKHFIRLELSTSPIGDLMSLTGEQKGRKTKNIAGIKVNLSVVQSGANPPIAGNPPLITASWQQQDVHFRLQSNGLTPGEVEKIIASTSK